METKVRQCKRCFRAIPATRKKSALYCSDECYYEAKKERSCISYQTGTAAHKAIRQNEKILAGFYLFVECGLTVTYDYLQKKGFNWGISNGETVGPGNLIGKIIGGYAYHLNPSTKIITLWKLKSNR